METETSKRRGRPPKLQEGVAILHSLGAEGQRRATENALYVGKAGKSLGAGLSGVIPSPYDWLNGRMTILAELGRLSEKYDIKPFAARICKLKPSAVEGAAILRRVRRGGMAPGSVDGLFNVLVTAFNQYIATHDPMPPEDQLLVVELVTEVFTSAIKSDGP